MRYAVLCVVLLGSAWLLMESREHGSSSRDWRWQAQLVLAALGFWFVGLSLLGWLLGAGGDGIMYLAKVLVAGMSIGIFISLWLAGWSKDFIIRNHGRLQ